MKRLTLALLFALNCLPHLASAASVDTSLGFLSRAVPFGAAAVAEIGRGTILWGKRESRSDFEYGYARAAARFAGSGFVNRGDLLLTLAPISIFALDGGITARRRFIREFATVDCTGMQCEGWTYGSLLRTRTVVGWKNLFGLLVSTLEHLRAELPYEPFIDEQSALRGGDPSKRIPGDYRREWFALAGLNLSSQWSVGFMHQSSLMLRSNQSSALNAVFMRHKLQSYLPGWDLTLGAGTFESSSFEQAPTAILRLEWNDQNSVELSFWMSKTTVPELASRRSDHLGSRGLNRLESQTSSMSFS
jgi:hypothetical protein